MDDKEEYPFIFMYSPPSLQLLASTEVALMLWRYKYSYGNSRCPNVSLFLMRKFSSEQILAIPPRIGSQIDQKINTIREELKKWIEFYLKQGFLDGDFRAAFSKCFKHIVADSCGAISLRETAVNILNSGEFSNVENYKIACAFCLEDQVRRFWPSVAKDERIGENVTISKRNLIFYWNRRMKSRKNSIKDTVSIKKRLDQSRTEFNWPAFEYFWKTLPDEEKVPMFIEFMNHGYFRAAILLLPTLNRVQAEKVFREMAPQILYILLPNEKYLQHIHRLWTAMRPVVLENQFRFFQVLHELWRMIFNPEAELGLNNARCDQINKFLLEIWSNTADEFKTQTYRSALVFFQPLSVYSSDFSCYFGHDMRFMWEVLDKSPNVDKQVLWRMHWRKLALRAKSSRLEQFMRLCLQNDEAVELYKRQLIEYRLLYALLIEHGFYSDLRDYLKFCSNNDEHFRALSKRMLGLNSHIIMLHDDDKFAKFEQFVGEVFSNVKNEMDKFKAQMILSAKCLRYLHVTFMEDGSSNFRKIIDRFVTSGLKLKLLKRKLLRHCRSYSNGQQPPETFHGADQCQQLLEWCTNDAEKISVLKRP